VEAERAALPELPRARRARYRAELGLSDQDADVLTGDPALAAWFERALQGPKGRREAKALANWIQGELLRHLNEQGAELGAIALTPEALGELIDLQAAGTINTSTAKALFREIVASGTSPAALVAERGLGQVSDRGAIEAAVRAALQRHPAAVEAFRAGNAKARGRIFGESMRQLGGRGDPRLVDSVLRDLLG
jgi:aspartyl-tRNA(Asn)/glutamyl-tRNA(Gln) amidotransferase subunit B